MSTQAKLMPLSIENKIISSNRTIVSEFSLKNSTFLVIYLGESPQNKAPFLPDEIASNSSYSVIGHFNFEENHYAIISEQNAVGKIDSNPTDILTARELQIAALVALGHSNKQVSIKLDISEWTVSAHLRRIFIKLKVDSRAAMVYRCASLINQFHQFQEF